MKITIKTLQQQTFTVEACESDTVEVLKQKIENEKGKDSFPADCQKLIYAGKILDNQKLISDYKIEEKNFVVAMITKAKPPPPKAAATSESTSEQATQQAESASQRTPAPATSEGDASATAETTPAPTTEATQPSDDSATDTASSVMSGATLEENVQSLMAMGFERDRVLTALRTSFYNRDRAVEYLVSGPLLPTDADELSPQQGGGGGGGNPLEYLRHQPQFQQLCNMLRGNASLLPGLLSELRNTNPELLAQINQNQEAFIELINSSGAAPPSGDEATPVAPTGEAAPPTGGNAPSGTQYIQVSTEDKEAIDRIKALGNFSESDVLQVYFACDKNETLAANMLFEDYM